jgi:L-lactate dehydrogenase complex protein LldG
MSREKIIASITRNKPLIKGIELPDYQIFKENIDLKLSFIKQAEAAGGKVIECKENSLEKALNENLKITGEVYSLTNRLIMNINRQSEKAPASYENLDFVIIEGLFGVAENGAVWVSDQQLSQQRVIPFITKNLILILSQESLVGTMHDAYDKIGNFIEGYGVFISGPSKTADIEQSLVIGAQGALSLTVVLFGK